MMNHSGAHPEALPKKKRGRPLKSESALKAAKISNEEIVNSKTVGTSKQQHREKVLGQGSIVDTSENSRVGSSFNEHQRAANPALLGQEIDGVIDGSFDAGYLVTIRMADRLYHGVLFENGLSDPVNTINDVAPHMKMVTQFITGLPQSSSLMYPTNDIPRYSSIP